MKTTFRTKSTPIVANGSTTKDIGGTANVATKHTFQVVADKGTTELISAGDFAADTGFTKGTGWTIADGVASCDGTQTADSLLTLTTPVTTVASTVYLIEFDVVTITAGNVAAQFDGIEVIADQSEAGTYRVLVAAADTSGEVDIVADDEFVGSIDNLSLSAVATTGVITISGKVDRQDPVCTYAVMGTIDLSSTTVLFWEGSVESFEFGAGATLDGSITVVSTSTR